MKRSFTVKPRNIRGSADDVAELIKRDITDRVDEANEGCEPPYVCGFIDGDVFAYAQDEIVCTGSISECIESAKTALKENADEDEMWDAVYDVVERLYDLGDIVRLFRDHKKELPDWYFD